ncbi:MAG TPA: hypothetical protein DCE39_03830 [Planctomycetaceae bacterium]|nr:hypothetical protein [Planctomycetaceae bacterium]
MYQKNWLRDQVTKPGAATHEMHQIITNISAINDASRSFERTYNAAEGPRNAAVHGAVLDGKPISTWFSPPPGDTPDE